MTVLLPWPSRQQRQADISRARAEKEQSVAAARHAAVIGRDIELMRHDNHIASAIAATLMRGHQDGTGR